MIAAIIRETLRRRWTGVYFYLFVAAIVMLAVVTVMSDLEAEAGLGPAMLAFFLAFELIGPEASSGSLQLVLARPVRRSSYLLARYAGVVLSATGVILIAAIAALVTAAIAEIPIDARPFAKALIATVVDTFFPMAMIAFFGAFTSSFANALLYLFYLVAVTVSASKVAELAPRFHARVWPELTPQVVPGVLSGHLVAISNALVVLVLAALILNRRELGYGKE